jgi:UPF0755 protein
MVRRRSTSRKSNGLGGLFFGIFLAALFVLAAAACLVYLPSGPEKEVFVEIPPGSSTGQIAHQLEQAGVVRTRYAFDLVRMAKRGTLKAGEYRFDHPAPVTEVYARIARGDVYTLAVTIPEGANRFEIATRVAQSGFLNITKEDFLAATVSQTALIADIDPKPRSLEGYLFPDTYRFQRKATSNQIVAAMVRSFKSAISRAQLTKTQTGPAQFGLWKNLHDAVTMASLVERETAVNAERPLVASVLSNRLAKNMPLMTDPSIIYGLELQNKYRGAIYQSDLADAKNENPYNTYRHTGLPPGPICNPGLPSLRAALSPAVTDYLYFVAAGTDPQGRSRFAATLDEHNKNVASYRKAIKQTGGR